MRKKTLLALLICFMAPTLLLAQAQPYNIVIKGGHVIDPKNNIDGPMDIAVRDGKIARVARNIDATGALQVVDATGMYVTPGLIDMHVHVFAGSNMDQTFMNGPRSQMPDGFTFRVGVTTVVDAGSAGWRTFADFKRQVIDFSQTRVLAFLNIVGEGMRGDPFEQNIRDMEVAPTVAMARRYPDHIIGVKLAHFVGHNWTPIERGVEAGKILNKPLMVDLGSANPPLPLDSVFLHYFNPGDIMSHCYGGGGAGRQAIVDGSGQLRPCIFEARKEVLYLK